MKHFENEFHLPSASKSHKPGVFTIVRNAEVAWYLFSSPNLVAGTPRVCSEMKVPFRDIDIDCGFHFIDRSVIAVADHGLRKAAENRFDNIQKLSSRGQGLQNNAGRSLNRLNSREFTRLTSAKYFLDECQEAASHDR